MLPEQKYLLLADCLSAFILAKVLTKSNLLVPIRIRLDRVYQSLMTKIGYFTAFSPSTCYLCVSAWTSAWFHQPGLFLPTYAAAYLVNAFSERNEILKRDS